MEKIQSMGNNCVYDLLTLGNENGEAQKHIDAAKEEIYKAMQIAGKI